MRKFSSYGTDVLPNNNILNIISKAKQSPYRELLLELFETDEKVLFKYDDERINFLYLNGVIDQEVTPEWAHYVCFTCPFVQKRLFRYFAGTVFREREQTTAPFEDLTPSITDQALHIHPLLQHYARYLRENRAGC